MPNGNSPVQLTDEAKRNIAAILKWSLKEFGEAAALRYSGLIERAIADIEENPELPGSQSRPELLIAGVRTYHLFFSRNHVDGVGVKEPRHFLLYRRREDGIIEVGGFIHEARDLQRHLPQAYLR